MRLAFLPSGSIILSRLPAWPAGSRVAVALDDVTRELARHSPGVRMEGRVDGSFVSVPTGILEAAVQWTLRSVAAYGLKFTPESYDCDDFACELDRTVSRIAALAGINSAPAIGCISVLQKFDFAGVQAGGAHALNVVHTDSGLWVVEPQNGRCIPLPSYPNRATIFAAYGF